MTETIRAEIEIGMPGACPVARASGTRETTVEDVSRSAGRDSSGQLTEEFTIENEGECDSEDEAKRDSETELTGSDPVFDLGSHTIYRFSRDPGTKCVCECIEQSGWPVSDVRADNGSLIVSFYAPDVESLKSVVTDLRDRFDQIQVRQLTQSGAGGDTDLLIVDRSSLTDRQREVLETAHEMGYFDYPKGANAGEVASELDITHSTFSEHLASGQGKLLDALLST